MSVEKSKKKIVKCLSWNFNAYLRQGARYLVRASSRSLAKFCSVLVVCLMEACSAFSLHHSTCRSYAFGPKQRSQCGHCSAGGGCMRLASERSEERIRSRVKLLAPGSEPVDVVIWLLLTTWLAVAAPAPAPAVAVMLGDWLCALAANLRIEARAVLRANSSPPLDFLRVKMGEAMCCRVKTKTLIVFLLHEKENYIFALTCNGLGDCPRVSCFAGGKPKFFGNG